MGELPVSSALTKGLAQQKEQLTSNLASRLGSNWERSSAGITSMAEFTKNVDIVKDQARRGEIAQLSGLTTPPQAAYQRAGLMGLTRFPDQRQYTEMQQPYQFSRQGQWESKKFRAEQIMGIQEGLGQAAGTMMMA